MIEFADIDAPSTGTVLWAPGGIDYEDPELERDELLATAREGFLYRSTFTPSEPYVYFRGDLRCLRSNPLTGEGVLDRWTKDRRAEEFFSDMTGIFRSRKKLVLALCEALLPDREDMRPREKVVLDTVGAWASGKKPARELQKLGTESFIMRRPLFLLLDYALRPFGGTPVLVAAAEDFPATTSGRLDILRRSLSLREALPYLFSGVKKT